jgi:DNA (cytosine-5)-methyltransferase 1
MSTLTVGSLFSGIGGLELGLKRAGMRTVWQVEKDDYCRKVLAKHWPDVQRFDDVCRVGAHNLSPVDLICGGFPCQDISTAGRGEGIVEGNRSGLWFEYRRIIRELRPRYVFVENVAALLARGLDIVLGDLAESGYDAEWDCIPAAAVGAPHRRDRLFLVAYTNSEYGRTGWQGRSHSSCSRQCVTERALQTLADTNCSRQQQQKGCVCHEWGRIGNSGADVSYTAGARLEGWNQPEAARRTLALIAGCYRAEYAREWEVEPGICRVVDGVPDWAHRIRTLGNAVVPQVAEYVGRLIVEFDARVTAQEAA